MVRTAHEWGYRWHWPPRIQDLQPWQWQVMTLAQRAENYITEHARQQAPQPAGQQFGSPSRRYADYDSPDDVLAKYQPDGYQ
jgi:hypothetical protein